MSTPHRATADHWAAVEEYAQYAQGVSSTDDCLLELRARVEALEPRPEQWEQSASALIERLSRLEEGYDELAARIEALEREAAMNELRAASAEARPAPFDEAAPAPASSLVERVRWAIGSAELEDLEAPEWMDEARAAIREVAAWLRDRGGYPWAWVAQVLEKEADR